MPHKPKAVIFDLGKVLLEFDYGKVAARMLNYCPLPREELNAALNQSPLLHRYETGLLTSAEFFEEVRRASKFTGGFNDFAPIFCDIFHPIPEMIALHRRLREQRIPTYIFSNTNELAIDHIRRAYPFFAHFSGYILSYEHRSMKPEPAIYEVVEKEAGARGSDLLYIDDRPENIEQGAALRWQTILHTDPRQTVPAVERLLQLQPV